MVSIGVASIGSVAISVGVAIAIGQPWVSLSLRLGLWLTGDEGGKANLGEYLYFDQLVGGLVVSSYHKSELHCYLSVQSRMILSRGRAQYIPSQSCPARATSRLLAFRSPLWLQRWWRAGVETRLQETWPSRHSNISWSHSDCNREMIKLSSLLWVKITDIILSIDSRE